MKLFDNTLICPVCKAILTADTNILKCENNHTYDIAKQGYVNLLPVNQKKSKDPGDDKTMLDARRGFLEKKYYDPLISKVVEIIEDNHNSISEGNPKILDAGCGEGYYMSEIKQKLDKKFDFLGFDISKYAIKIAAKKQKEMSFFVSSIKQIPVQSNSMDFIISIFSPIGEAEFHRTLKEDGKIIIVTPNSNHLKGLTDIIYPQHNEHSNRVDNYNKELFNKIDEKTLTFNISLLSNKDIMNLFTMTPYYYSTSKEKSQKLEDYDKLDVLIDFTISILEKKVLEV